MAASAYTDTVQKVYIAYYGRAADPVGLAYWSKAIDDAGGSLDAIMTSFGTSAEATTLYGSLSNSAKVNAIYQQSFGRDADFTGLMYYSGQLSAGTMTASSIAQNIFDGATGTDATTLTNKLAVAKAYTTAIDTASEVIAYSGTVAAASARTLLSTVDSTTTTSGFDVDTSIAAMVTAANVVPKTAAEITAAAKVISDAADVAAAKVITDAAKVVADAKVLADAATSLCHNETASSTARQTAEITFEQGGLGDKLPMIEIAKSRLDQGVPAFQLFREVRLASSGGEARRLIKGGGAKLNDVALPSEVQIVTTSDLDSGGVMKLSVGKKLKDFKKIVYRRNSFYRF